MCITKLKIMYTKRLSTNCCNQSLCLVHPLLHAGNDQMHHISLWLGQQPNCWGISLAYFLLNDQDKACYYHSNVWIISCHFPISSSSICTMQPTTVLPLNCKEWIYWWHQFLNLLIYIFMKSNWYIVCIRSKYTLWSSVWIVTV